jgi:DNA sulfur modification protein DndD
MKIERMRIDNWRSFYKDHEIIFATDPENNVTLIRAENGFGKTNLLAAINWCLFGILPPPEDFQNPKNLLNDHAKNIDKSTKARIELEFEHKGKSFKATRTYDQPNERTNALRIVEIRDGAEIPLSASVNVDRFINAILPKEMAPHFFFYGEATSKYTNQQGAEAFGTAVKNILGATAATLALSDLERALREYQREAASHSSSEAIKIESEIQKIEEKRGILDDALKIAKEEDAAADKLIEQINKQLLGSEQVGKDQARRDKLNADLKTCTARLQRSQSEAHRWFDNYGTSILAQSFVRDVKSLLEQEDTRRKIPGDFNEKFVKELLEDKLCICGRPLGHGTEEEAHVKSMLDAATDRTMVDRVMSTQAALGKLEAQAKLGWNAQKKTSEEQAQLVDQLEQIESELNEISERLRSNDIKAIAEKEEARRVAKSKQRFAIQTQGQILDQQNNNKRRIEQLARDRDRLVRESIAAQRFVRRTQVTGELVRILKDRLETEERFAQINIKFKMDKIITAFLRKSFHIRIDRNYKVTVIDDQGNNAALSDGEKLLFGLAFTGSIAEFARDRQHEDVDILLSGTDAPLVIDSPFGDLDTTYRRAVASFLPKMAPQVILLVSSSQAESGVLSELQGKVGEQYVLRRFEQDQAGDRNIERIEVNGKVIDLTQYGQSFTGTIVEEVK